MKIIAPITFLNRLIKENELGQPFKLSTTSGRFYTWRFRSSPTAAFRGDSVLYYGVKTTVNGTPTL